MMTKNRNRSNENSQAQVATLRQLLVRLAALASEESRLLVLGSIGLLLGSAINLFFPYFLRGIINESFGFDVASDLPKIVAILLVLFLLQASFFYVRHFCFYWAGYRAVARLRKQLFQSIIFQDSTFFDTSRTGDLLSRLTSDTQLIQRAVTVNISVLLRYSIQVIGGICLMLFLSAKLTLIILLLLPLLVAASMYWGRKLRTLSRHLQENLSEANVVADETFAAHQTVKLFAGADYESGRYRSAIDQSLATSKQRTKVAAFFSSMMVFFMHSSIAIVFWQGSEMVLAGTLGIGDLTAFMMYGVIVAVSLGFLASTWDELMQAVGAQERVFEIIDTPLDILEPSNPKPLASGSRWASVEFSNVSFSYQSRASIPVLKSVSFTISPGETVALVGPSGSGKSTIAALLPRLYDVSSGSIRFNGVDIREASIADLRDRISVVSQNPQMFSLSLFENIRYGRTEATEHEVREAASAAALDEFIESLPDGLATMVGDKGIQLSGGQKQRLAIARAIIKNPELLILDEATSSLDSHNEALIQKALETVLQNRSALVIAHRLSTVQSADKVIVLKRGEIIQTGTHRSLIEGPGLYRSFVEQQMLA